MNRYYNCTMRLSIIVAVFFNLTTINAQEKPLCLFSPYDKPTQALVAYIANTKKSIHAAMYFLTDKVIIDALINAKKRGVVISLILDPCSCYGRFNKADLLFNAGIVPFVFSSKINKEFIALNTDGPSERWGFFEPLMHNKFAIFDEQILWTGSFNWTGAANTQNYENVVIFNNKELSAKYLDYHKKVRTSVCVSYTQNTGKMIQLSSLHQNITAALNESIDEQGLAVAMTQIMTTYMQQQAP